MQRACPRSGARAASNWLDVRAAARAGAHGISDVLRYVVSQGAKSTVNPVRFPILPAARSMQEAAIRRRLRKRKDALKANVEDI